MNANGNRSEIQTITHAVAECDRLLAAGDLPAAKEKLLALDDAKPANEQEWTCLHSICIRLGDRTRAQVFTERFLEVHEDNAAAHLANARNFGSVTRDRDRILESVARALKNPRPDADFWREITSIQSGLKEHEAACESARKTIGFDPGDVAVREILIASL